MLAAAVCLLLACCLQLAQAEAPGQVQTQVPATDAEPGGLQLERAEDGLYLSASLQFDLPQLAEDALDKGIPMFFVAEARVLRPRWYWSDRLVRETSRHFKLSYQPLTRRWRLNISALPFSQSGLGVVLGQSFDDYADALSAIGRFSHWKIAQREEIAADAAHMVNFRLRLDIARLPRLFQIDAVGRPGWDLLAARSQRLVPPPQEPHPAAEPAR